MYSNTISDINRCTYNVFAMPVEGSENGKHRILSIEYPAVADGTAGTAGTAS